MVEATVPDRDPRFAAFLDQLLTRPPGLLVEQDVTDEEPLLPIWISSVIQEDYRRRGVFPALCADLRGRGERSGRVHAQLPRDQLLTMIEDADRQIERDRSRASAHKWWMLKSSLRQQLALHELGVRHD